MQRNRNTEEPGAGKLLARNCGGAPAGETPALPARQQHRPCPKIDSMQFVVFRLRPSGCAPISMAITTP